MKKLMLVIVLFVLSYVTVYSQQTTVIDSTEIKLVEEYNSGVKQLEALVEQKGLLEGTLSKKAEYISKYGTIDSAMITSNPDLKRRLDEYEKLNANLKKVSDYIPQLKGSLQAIVDEINIIREKRKK